MNIGFFSPTINRIGGGEWVTLNMIRALQNADAGSTEHGITVYSSGKIDSAHIASFLGKELHFNNQVEFPRSIFDPFGLESLYPNLLRSYIFKLKCDLLIDTFSNDLLPWTDAVYFNGGVRSVLLPRGVKGMILLPYKAFARHALESARAEEKTLMACSRIAARVVEEVTKLKVHVLYPPLSDFFKRENIDDQQRDNSVVTVVRISRDKNPETIPEIARLTPEDTKFTIIGSCRTQDEVSALARLKSSIRNSKTAERVKLMLNVSREQQREVLQRSRVYLHPSVSYEGFGITVVEAMAAGCTPIVPDVGGLKEIVPRFLRYTSISEAASLVKASIANWSPSKAEEFVRMSDKFNTTRFNKEFLKIMKL
jgi:glycosyltransferase involved in cell wall biosynthesis